MRPTSIELWPAFDDHDAWRELSLLAYQHALLELDIADLHDWLVDGARFLKTDPTAREFIRTRRRQNFDRLLTRLRLERKIRHKFGLDHWRRRDPAQSNTDVRDYLIRVRLLPQT